MVRTRMKVTYLKMELKRAGKQIPALFAGVVLLLALSGTAVFLASRMLYAGTVVERIHVGISMPEQDPLAKQVVRMLSTLDSVKSICEFSYMDRESALEALEKGDVYAVLDVPENFVQDILRGKNTPVTIWTTGHMGIEGQVFRELADAGALTLSAGQAGIYAGNELYHFLGLDESIAQLELDLNSKYMEYGLQRSVYFRHQNVQATGDIGVIPFYEISAFVLLLFLAAIPVSGYLLPWKKAMAEKLKLAGISIGSQVGARIIGMGVLLFLGSLPVILILLMTEQLRWSGILAVVWPLSCVAASSVVVLLYRIAGNHLGGIMLLFFVMTGQHFLAGGILPLVFLPHSFQMLAPWLPSAILMNSMKMAVSGTWDNKRAGACVILIVAAWLAGILAERKGQ